LQYWELRGDPTSGEKVLPRWRRRIEKLLQQAVSNVDSDFPKSFAA
jgi:hypothetical protein